MPQSHIKKFGNSDKAWFHLTVFINSLESTISQKYVQENNCGSNTSTITGDVYQDIIQQFLSQIEKSECRSCLQQDNAHPHVSTNTMSFQCKFFNERLISTNLRPPCSPDLSPMDFSLWGYLKNRMYMTAPRNLEELDGNIAREIENIDQKTLKLVFLNLMKRCRICKVNSGRHFQHSL